MKRLFKTLQGLWSLAVGLKITGVELFKPWLTVHYPRQEVDNLATFRGHIELVPAADDPRTPRCIMCWKCVEICPSRCISLRLHAVGEGAEAGDPGLLLAPELWWLWSSFGGVAQGGGITLIFIAIIRLARDQASAGRMSAVVQGVGYSIGALAPTLLGYVNGVSGSWTGPLLMVFGSVAMFILGTALSLRHVPKVH